MERSDRYYLPASNDGIIHRRLDVVIPHNLEGLSLVSHYGTELFHVARFDSNLRTHKVLMNINFAKFLIVAIPQLPVKPFNAFITASGDFVNGCEALGRTVLELE
jgi:hypothetical protein